jgi:prepilin-type N-terminal cleavage/methylation domain-containing protein
MTLTRPATRGFTLVELLAVIVIIGVLATLSLYGASVAMVAAKNGRIAMDIKQLETGIQSYVGTRGSYPPDLIVVSTASKALELRAQAIRSHLVKVAPRYAGPMPLLPDTPLVSGVNVDDARKNIAAEALVFWLGGYSALPDGKGGVVNSSTKLKGFRADPANPFVTDLNVLKQGPGWKRGWEFDETRLVDLDGDGWFEYLPPHCPAPYVYFNAKGYINTVVAGALPKCEWPLSTFGTASPYAKDGSGFMNDKTFQIISAGQDGVFSLSPDTFRRYPSGEKYSSADNDNLTNFSERTLGDATGP